ncbi:MAG: hypothetical protein JXR95_08520 [Deltaproteobacteria bacterium]|nr:hypothetical protein [Deltaproteobacteria bacterium]
MNQFAVLILLFVVTSCSQTVNTSVKRISLENESVKQVSTSHESKAVKTRIFINFLKNNTSNLASISDFQNAAKTAGLKSSEIIDFVMENTGPTSDSQRMDKYIDKMGEFKLHYAVNAIRTGKRLSGALRILKNTGRKAGIAFPYLVRVFSKFSTEEKLEILTMVSHISPDKIIEFTEVALKDDEPDVVLMAVSISEDSELHKKTLINSLVRVMRIGDSVQRATATVLAGILFSEINENKYKKDIRNEFIHWIYFFSKSEDLYLKTVSLNTLKLFRK